ncbi:hypothetical protein PF005_g9151 [Phytophthora fragariae]|uniref:RxLR effector protein n=1 Tax=Phytophthora fragariae TaxID=53985 RepID=A0A6A3RAC6_9STRA|nr:hypothetical protein PF003_g34294 [Phytophthora fragariae]KAE8940375.1 hypothetical protein PF009_g9807 [Phytophthora fragariae]KAE9092303.1 hypothetical protein PF010_g17862 [Phytophthora fragariae]KAE9092644.1 hypothetical protein PF007_g18405 [Phytophthora fragariae]KAE9124509.1 hypothetical protein PF006_g17175 [Phytophthora fragariae]
MCICLLCILCNVVAACSSIGFATGQVYDARSPKIGRHFTPPPPQNKMFTMHVYYSCLARNERRALRTSRGGARVN